jgi:anti-anti-sigma factor
VSSTMADLGFDRHDAIASITLSGEVDLSNVPDLRRRIFGAIRNDDRAVIVDLADLAFIDSAGLGMLFELSEVLDERRQRLFVVVPPGTQPRRTIDIVGFGTSIGVVDDRDAALEAARDEGRAGS